MSLDSHNLRYPADYLRQLHKEISVEPPDTNRLNGYSEPLKALYEAHQKGGVEAVRTAWETALRIHPELFSLWQRAGLNRNILHASQLKTLPPVEWLINGMIPKRALCELHGAPGSGKSLLTLHLAAQIAAEQPVLYLAAEGASGYVNRIAAWEAAYERTVGHLYFDIDALSLLEPEEVQAFVAAITPHKPSLIILDTLARCMIGGDENSAQDMGQVIKACDFIRKQTDATILLVHHTGKTTSNERGSSALRGGCDSMIELINNDGLITVASSKLKDGKPFDTFYMQMVEFCGSVALKSSERTINRQGQRLTEAERKVLQMLELEIFRTAGARYSRIEEHTSVRGGTLDRVLSSLKRRGYIRQDKRGEPYTLSAEGLQALST